jgi:hypothetical protein
MSSYEKNEKKQISVEQAQEQINKYEKIFNEKSTAVAQLKDKLILAQEERTVAQQEFFSVKEQYLLSIINALQEKKNKKDDVIDITR